MQIFPGFVHMFGFFGHHLWVYMSQKTMGKLIQNMFLGPFIFSCDKRPGATLICKV